MLVLSRRLGQSLVAGDDFKVTVLNVRNDRVSLGITAPDNIAIHREEVYLRTDAQHRSESKAKINNTEIAAHSTKIKG